MAWKQQDLAWVVANRYRGLHYISAVLGCTYNSSRKDFHLLKEMKRNSEGELMIGNPYESRSSRKALIAPIADMVTRTGRSLRWTEEEEAKVLSDLRDGDTIERVAKRYKRTPDSVIDHFGEMGVDLKPEIYARWIEEAKQKEGA